MKRFNLGIAFALIAVLSLCSITSQAYSNEKKKFGFVDVMKFNAFRYHKISADGRWISYCSVPDRGDGKAVFQSTVDSVKYEIERGDRPVVAKTSQWAACFKLGKAIEIENAKTGKDKPKQGMTLLNLVSGDKTEFTNIASFKFSDDGKWIAIKAGKDDAKGGDDKKFKDKEVGTLLSIRHLRSGTEIRVDNVREYLFDSTSSYVFYAVSGKPGDRDGIYYRDLNKEFAPEVKVKAKENAYFGDMTWADRSGRLGFLFADLKESGKAKDCSLGIFEVNSGKTTVYADTTMEKDWYVPSTNDLSFTKDGKTLYFGMKPVSERYDEEDKTPKFTDSTFYNIDTIESNAEVNVWHWNDPLISSNQKQMWSKEKDRTYYAIVDERGKIVRLSSPELEEIGPADNHEYVVGYDANPYKKERTWYGDKYDLYAVNQKSGDKLLIAKALEENATMAPDGKYIAYFKDKQWYLYSCRTAMTVCITDKTKNEFWDVEHDTPSLPPSAGFAGWVDDGKYGLIYDKFDIWMFESANPANFRCVSDGAGRKASDILRIWDYDKEKPFFGMNDTLFVSVFNDAKKTMRVYRASLASTMSDKAPQFLNDSLKLAGENRFRMIAKAEESNKIIYTREKFEEFPDVWLTDINLSTNTKLTDGNAQIKDYIWGKTQLIEWKNGRGQDLQGYLITPDNWDGKSKLPVFVYFYERMSDRTYSFVMPMLTHRPCYQVYLSDGYAVFLPDIKYVPGNPGYDALDAIMRGSRKIIEMGIADSTKFCIQGHSWGAYQTAFIATQTNFFKAACAGAPVGNMTSAYSQIRLESGLTRMFQYEAQQSRIGGTLWDSLDNYIRNSPVFQARTMNTPLLIGHGDVDEAVPFIQGIELYMVMRRLSKPAILLHYENEPHWQQRYRNKLDYSKRMKEFFDHYILGTPAPAWMTEGVPYKGR